MAHRSRLGERMWGGQQQRVGKAKDPAAREGTSTENVRGVKCRHQHCTWAEFPAKEQRPPTWAVKGLYAFHSFIL